jgi:hypothetical protein
MHLRKLALSGERLVAAEARRERERRSRRAAYTRGPERLLFTPGYFTAGSLKPFKGFSLRRSLKFRVPRLFPRAGESGS